MSGHGGAPGGGGLPSPDVGSLMTQLAEQQSQGGDDSGGSSGGGAGSLGDLSALSGMMGAGGSGAAGGGGGHVPGGQSTGPSTPTDRVTELVNKGIDTASGQLFNLLPESVQHILKIGAQDSEEEKARKQQMITKINQMDQERFQVFKQRVAQEEKLKQQEEEMRRQQDAQKAQATPELSMPTGKTGRGSALTGGKSSKKSATNLLQTKRKSEPNSPD